MYRWESMVAVQSLHSDAVGGRSDMASKTMCIQILVTAIPVSKV